jgi:homoserine dehydrogenase
LHFESNLHTLPPHFELKTEQTKELMDSDDTVSFKEKESYYVVIQTDGEEPSKVEALIKAELPFHKSLAVTERDARTVGLIVVGLDESPESAITEAGYVVNKIYPVEGV